MLGKVRCSRCHQPCDIPRTFPDKDGNNRQICHSCYEAMNNSLATAEEMLKNNIVLDVEYAELQVEYAELQAEFEAYKKEHSNLWTGEDLVMGSSATYALPRGTYVFYCDVEGLSEIALAELQAFTDDTNRTQVLDEGLTEETLCTLEVDWDAPTVFSLSGSEGVSCKNIKLVRID